MDLSIVILVFESIRGPHDRFIWWHYYGPREVFHPFPQGELEFYVPFLHVNHGTNSAQKRSTKNNWARRIALNIKNNQIYGNKIPTSKDKNIIDLSHRFFNGGIRQVKIQRTLLKIGKTKNIT